MKREFGKRELETGLSRPIASAFSYEDTTTFRLSRQTLYPTSVGKLARLIEATDGRLLHPSLHPCLKLFASIFHVAEEVEASAARTEQNGIARLCQTDCLLHALLHGMGIGYRKSEGVKGCMEFTVVHSHINKGTTFLPNEGNNLRIVISLILATEDEYDGGSSYFRAHNNKHRHW